MAAFFITQVEVNDSEKFQQYTTQALPVFAAFGGKMLARGSFSAVVVGAAPHSVAAVVAFPSMQDLHSAFASEAYQALVPLRDEAARVRISAYEAME